MQINWSHFGPKPNPAFQIGQSMAYALDRRPAPLCDVGSLKDMNRKDLLAIAYALGADMSGAKSKSKVTELVFKSIKKRHDKRRYKESPRVGVSVLLNHGCMSQKFTYEVRVDDKVGDLKKYITKSEDYVPIMFDLAVRRFKGVACTMEVLSDKTKFKDVGMIHNCSDDNVLHMMNCSQEMTNTMPAMPERSASSESDDVRPSEQSGAC